MDGITKTAKQILLDEEENATILDAVALLKLQDPLFPGNADIGTCLAAICGDWKTKEAARKDDEVDCVLLTHGVGNQPQVVAVYPATDSGLAAALDAHNQKVFPFGELIKSNDASVTEVIQVRGASHSRRLFPARVGNAQELAPQLCNHRGAAVPFLMADGLKCKKPPSRGGFMRLANGLD